jgi:hypothetical protein
MLKQLALAAALLVPAYAATTTPANAQISFSVRIPSTPVVVWRPSFHPYPAPRHSICQRKAWRLHWFDQNARADGFYSRWERTERRILLRDLDATCGRFRWRI